MEKQKLAMTGSIVSAIVASACCIGPLVAVLLGVSGFAAAAAFEKWRPLFLLATVALLGLAWYLTYRQPKEACAEGSTCAIKPVARWNKLALWVATAFVAATATFPMYSGVVARFLQPAQATATGAAGTQLATLKVKVSGMHCGACAASVEAALQRQGGVQNAQVSYDTKEAVVQYDPQQISRDKIVETINQTGYQAEL